MIGPESITVNVCPDCNEHLRYSPSWCSATGKRHTCPDTARPVKYVRADLALAPPRNQDTKEDPS